MKFATRLLALLVFTYEASPAKAEGFHPIENMEHKLKHAAESAAIGIMAQALFTHRSLKETSREAAHRIPVVKEVLSSIEKDENLADSLVGLAVAEQYEPAGDNAIKGLQQIIHRHRYEGVKIVAQAVANYAVNDPNNKQGAAFVAVRLGIPKNVYAKAVLNAEDQKKLREKHLATMAAKMAKGGVVTEDDDPDCATTDVDLTGSFAELEDSIPATAAERRNKTPGIATGGENLPYITEEKKWFYDVGNYSYALIPRQVATALRNHPYRNFGALRVDIWKAIARDDLLFEKGHFSEGKLNDRNRDNMRQGAAPVRGNAKYEIHHIIPISLHGSVYGFDNLLITTSICHRKIHRGMKQ